MDIVEKRSGMGVKGKCKYFFVLLFVLVLSFFVQSCLEPEHPLPVIPDPELQSIEINADDQAAYYYNLSQKKVVKSNKIIDWDLRLCAQADKYYIYLNTAKNMRLAKYDGKFSDIVKVSDITNWQTDLINEGKALTVMGSWGDFSFTNPKSYGHTYVIDMGYLNSINEFGYRKLEVLGCTDNHYILKLGMLDDPFGDTIKIEKKSQFNSMYLSMGGKARVVTIEPTSAEWDLLFTQYGLSSLVIKDGKIIDTTYAWTDAILLNTTGRQISHDTVKTFDDITFWDAEKYVYDNSIDYIGNKWRVKNADNQYEVSKRNIYIVKTSNNLIYKIEFKSVDKTNPRITKIVFRVKNL